MGREPSGEERANEITAVMELFNAREMAALHRVVVSLSAQLGSREVARRFVGGSRRLLDSDFAYLMLCDEAKGLELIEAQGLEDPVGVDDNAADVVESAEPSLILAGRALSRSLVGDRRPTSLVYVPLCSPTDVTGVLCVGSFTSLYSVKSSGMLTLLAQPAARALEGARQFEASTLMSQQLQTMVEAQRALASGGIEETFPSFCAALAVVIPVDLALLWDYDPVAKEYIISEAWAPQGDLARGWVRRRVAAGRSLHGHSLGQPGTVRVDLERPNEGLERVWLGQAGMHTGVICPLSSRARAVGIFSVWTKQKGAYRDQERDFLGGMSQQLALSVRNQRLFNQLERAKLEWESTFDVMNDAVWIANESQHVQRFNKAFSRAVDLSYDQILGTSAAKLIGVDPFELSFQSNIERQRGRFRREIEGSRLGRSVEVIATRSSTSQGPVVFVARDVTEAREMNTRLQQASRLAGLGQLASAMAHEINNPLSYIAANLHRIQQWAESPSKLQEDGDELLAELPVLVGESLDGVSRVKGIVEKLQIYSKSDREEVSTFSLNELVDFCLTLVWATLRQRATVVKRYGEMPSYRGNQHLLSQVLVNTFVSAAKSLDPTLVENNQLKVVTDHDAEGWEISISAVRGGEPVTLTDKGGFEPVEAGDSEPTLQGFLLEPDLELLREMGGRAMMIGASGHPTELVLRLPRQDKTEDELRRSVTTLPGVRPANGRILIVDDEPYIRRALRRVLSTRHEVEIARDGAQALEMLERDSVGFDVILCDVVMPGISGLDMVQVISERWPELRERVVFITGGVFSAEAEALLQSGPNPVLRKPVGPRELVNAVEQVLGHRGA